LEHSLSARNFLTPLFHPESRPQSSKLICLSAKSF
jgi:hypothetical protein